MADQMSVLEEKKKLLASEVYSQEPKGNTPVDVMRHPKTEPIE
jgi:hypothetical protein